MKLTLHVNLKNGKAIKKAISILESHLKETAFEWSTPLRYTLPELGKLDDFNSLAKKIRYLEDQIGTHRASNYNNWVFIRELEKRIEKLEKGA